VAALRGRIEDLWIAGCYSGTDEINPGESATAIGTSALIGLLPQGPHGNCASAVSRSVFLEAKKT
jgi:hypothetical protein